MNNNVPKFNHAFNELHALIAEKTGENPNTNFGVLLDKAEKNNKIVKHYKQQLDVFRQFRNILTHKTYSETEAIAIPSDTLINEIQEITSKIKYSKKVKDLFESEVICFDIKDPIIDVLKAIEKNGYSQFPVFEEGKLKGIVSENGITNFLAKSISDDIISISEILVSDVIELDEKISAYKIINANKSIYDIEEMFSSNGIANNILLITKDGKVNSKEDFTGVITPWDMPKIINNK
ncbi:CBS domain-containing protein [Vagococcus fluvialis]|uniref:CBS domain-containing protein n=1 Tax=Vagococcus fluvialis TaxID=2738 RepID=UPI0037D8B016